MRDELNTETPAPTNGADYTGVGLWELNRWRRRREARRDLVGLALLLAATLMGVVIGFVLCLCVKGGG